MYKKVPIPNKVIGINTTDSISSKTISAPHPNTNAVMMEAMYRSVEMTPKIFAFFIFFFCLNIRMNFQVSNGSHSVVKLSNF